MLDKEFVVGDRPPAGSWMGGRSLLSVNLERISEFLCGRLLKGAQ